MARRKGGRGRKIKIRGRTTATLTFSKCYAEPPPSNGIAEEAAEEEGGGKKCNFFACYLLTSLNPRSRDRTYIGFTVNPKRRIRQHNGEISSGARRTKSRRPWEMVLCIYGFPTNVAALKFEWAWQHPTESVNVRQAAAAFKSLNGLANKIKLAHTMLTLPLWQSLNLTVNYFSTKCTKHAAGCPTLPENMRVQIGSMDDLPCYTRGSLYAEEDNELHFSEEGSDQSGGSRESAENESTEGNEVNGDIPVAQDVVEQGGGHAKRTTLGRTEISQSSEDFHKDSTQYDPYSDGELPYSFSDCDELTMNAEDSGIFRLSDELQSKNLGFGEQEVHSQSLRLSEEFRKGSIQHDPSSYGELPFLFTDDCDEFTTNGDDRGIFLRSSDELKLKNSRFGEQEVHSQSSRLSEEFCKGSIQHDPNSYGDLPFSFIDCDELTTNAEDKGIFRLSDELLSKNSGFGEQEVLSQSLHVNDCSVSSNNNIIIISEDEEVSCSRDEMKRCRESEVLNQSFQLNGCRFRTPSLSGSSCNNVETDSRHRERVECIDVPDQVEEDRQTRKNAVSDKKAQSSQIIADEVVVIDLFTPSPCKKKGRKRSETEIIDLTISPLVV